MASRYDYADPGLDPQYCAGLEPECDDESEFIRYYVITPEYGVMIPVTDDGQGPMEYGCDLIEIEATSARDAVALGVQEMLKGR